MGCIRRLFLLLALGVVVVIALALFLPHLFAQAGNSVISAFNGSNPSISGLVQFVPANVVGKDNTLQITVSGLTANAKYEVTLDPNSCGANNSFNVGIITADASGNVNSSLPLATIDLNTNWFVDIHNGVSAGDAVLACGQLNINNSSVAIEATNSVIQLSPTSGQGNSEQVTPSPDVTPTPQTGYPNTGVAPGGAHSYDNNVYPRKY
jgi:hypothetical protein